MLELGHTWDPDEVIDPSDWAALAETRVSASGEPVVDVVIPVRGHGVQALRALYSALSAPQQTPFRVVVCDVANVDETFSSLLREIAQLGLIDVVHRRFDRNPDRDVVVLSPDALVFNDWLDRLRAHASERDDIGTATPLTPDGPLGGYPVMGGSGDEALELGPAELDALAADVNAGTAVEAPTGAGPCVYLTRRCLEVTGGLEAAVLDGDDSAVSDLCQRAISAGLSTLVCADVYVWHQGRATEVGPAELEPRHPGYAASLHAFVADDPLKLARCRLDAARIAGRTGTADRATLQVLHTHGGGTEQHVHERAAHLRSEGRHSVYCQPVDSEAGTFRFFDPGIPNTPNLDDLNVRVPLSTLVGLFELLRIDTIHVHQMLGYAGDAAAYFTGLAEEARVALDVTLHDYTMICPRINLASAGGAYCGEPDEANCQRCVDTMGSPVGTPTIWLWRRSHGALLRAARHVWAPSNDVINRFGRYFPDVRIELRPHEDLDRKPVDRRKPPRHPTAVSRFAVLGVLSRFKGSRVVLDVARAAAAKELPIEIVVIGYSNIDEKLLATGKVHITGAYDNDQLDQLIYDEDIDAVWFPAIVPETYSFTLTAALETELPIIAFDLGAVAERLRDADRASGVVPLVLHDDPEQVLDVLRGALPSGSPAALT